MVTDFKHSPMIRAAITKINGTPSADILAANPNMAGEAVYMLGGAGGSPEILMTTSPTLPSRSRSAST